MCITVAFYLRKWALLWQDCNTLTEGPILSERVGLALTLFARICDVLGLSLGRGTA
jgi:hypothetical protein